MVLINRYIDFFLSRGKENKKALFYTQLAAFIELMIFLSVVLFFVIRFTFE